MRKFLLGGAALSAVAVAASADEFDSRQAENTELMSDLLAALAASDSSKIAAIDSRIDYAVNRSTNTTIMPGNMVELFAGCAPRDMESAQRFRDTMILNFECPGRQVADNCSTGNLRIMVFRDPRIAVGVIEDQRIGPDCRMPAPPPSPPRAGGN